MISFDLECANEHRFEGFFKDYLAFDIQHNKGLIECPFCGDARIKRLFTGCSIQAGGSSRNITDVMQKDNPAKTDGQVLRIDKSKPNIFEMIRVLRDYVTKNYDNVGKDFADKARAIHYGIEEERNIYGESTPEEIKELIDEGVSILPIPATDTDA